MRDSKTAIVGVALMMTCALPLKSFGDKTVQIHGASCHKVTDSFAYHHHVQITWDNPERFDSSVVVERSDVGAYNPSTTEGTVLECRASLGSFPYHSTPYNPQNLPSRMRAFLQGRHMAPVPQKLQVDFAVIHAFGPTNATKLLTTNILPAAGQYGERFTIATGWFDVPASGGYGLHTRFWVSMPPQTMLYTIYVKAEAWE